MSGNVVALGPRAIREGPTRLQGPPWEDGGRPTIHCLLKREDWAGGMQPLSWVLLVIALVLAAALVRARLVAPRNAQIPNKPACVTSSGACKVPGSFPPRRRFLCIPASDPDRTSTSVAKQHMVDCPGVSPTSPEVCHWESLHCRCEIGCGRFGPVYLGR